MYLNDIYTIGANLAGVPAMSHSVRLRARPAGRHADMRPAFRGSEAAERRARVPEGNRLASQRFPRRTSGEAVMTLGNRHRSRDPRAALDEVEDLLGLSHRLWLGAELAGQSRRPRVSRRVARAERGSRAHGREVRPRGRRDHAPQVGVRAQELLLSGSAEGLPDQPVRAAHRREGHWTSCSRTARRRRIGITRAHLEEDAGKSLHEGLPEAVRHRPQPRRHAAASKSSPSPTCARRRRRWPI